MTFKLAFESFNDYEQFIENWYWALGMKFGLYSPNRASSLPSDLANFVLIFEPLPR
jgi:hypothetical protein